MVAQISTGTLCTLAVEPEGYPYGSFVTVAFENADPIFLISGLAEHTKNLERDPRASLLVAEGSDIASIDELRGAIAAAFEATLRPVELLIPYEEGGRLSELHALAGEREAGFLEQVVLPMLKQRNPQARKAAADALSDLTRLGQGLRAAKLRQALRKYIEGQ